MQPGPQPIVIVTTGGTIDKAYFDALSTYQIGEPVVKKLLEGANVTHPYRIVELLRKDSLELTDEDRGRLKETVAALDELRVVITHGTDTMTDSAAVLAAIPAKTIVLTGALSPARFSDSDATFKHGPAVGRYTAALANGTNQNIEPRFSLQSKAGQQRRDVH